MKDIFLISDKQENFNIFYSNLGHLPVHFSWGGGIDEALQSLPIEKPSFIFLVTDNLGFLNDWIDRILQKGITSPIVCFTKHTDQGSRKKIWEKGITELVQLPKHYKEFEYIIKFITQYDVQEADQRENRLQGRLQDFSLVELIQTFGDAGKNGVLKIFKANAQGDILFNRGRIANARLRNYDPLEAIVVMSTWFSGRFEMEPDREFHRERITLNNQQIIAHCQEEMQHRNQIIRQLPDLNQKLFTRPDLNYEEVEPRERSFLLQFKNGATLNGIIEMHSGHSVRMLQQFKRWLDNQLLLDPQTYDKFLNDLKESENVSGIRKVFSKMFSRSSADKHVQPEYVNDVDTSLEEQAAQRVQKKPNLFRGRQRIEDFIKELEAAT